jgi:hypothetical protein
VAEPGAHEKSVSPDTIQRVLEGSSRHHMIIAPEGSESEGVTPNHLTDGEGRRLRPSPSPAVPAQPAAVGVLLPRPAGEVNNAVGPVGGAQPGAVGQATRMRVTDSGVEPNP